MKNTTSYGPWYAHMMWANCSRFYRKTTFSVTKLVHLIIKNPGNLGKILLVVIFSTTRWYKICLNETSRIKTNIMEFLRDFEHEMNHYSIIGNQTIALKVKIHKAEKRSFIIQTENRKFRFIKWRFLWIPLRYRL